MKQRLKYTSTDDDNIKPRIVSDSYRRKNGQLENETLLTVPDHSGHLTTDEVDILLEVLDSIGLKLTLSKGFVLTGPKEEFIDLLAYVIKSARRELA